MKENRILDIIKETLTDNHYIGNDCADLNELGLFITQDTLVEDVHFSLKTTTPYQLGQKAVEVNISDLAVPMSNPVYISVALSLPGNISEDFVRELYKGINSTCIKYGIFVTGGDITGSDKIHISVTAIGRRRHSINISRNFAKPGNFIMATGTFGTSAAGLYALNHGIKVSDEIINAYLTPEARLWNAHEAGKYIEEDFAGMDTSDGLGDALYKIAKASNVSINVILDDLPILPEVRELALKNNIDIKDWVLWGGDDYELLYCASYYHYSILSSKGFNYIGYIEEKNDENTPFVQIQDKDNLIIIDENLYNQKSFNHFGG
ncbi:thiamine-phosphate kinase [bacterium]|nr:thiamine-phosphate kinase [bacterium]